MKYYLVSAYIVHVCRHIEIAFNERFSNNKKMYNAIRLYTDYIAVLCALLLCGSSIKTVSIVSVGQGLKTKKVRIADRREKIIWEPKRTDIYRGRYVVMCVCVGLKIIYFIMLFGVCVYVYVCVCIILYTILYVPIHKIYIFTFFNASAAGDEDTTIIII